ncbi:arylalkylamine N-acetyltransferase 1 [Xylocopa sonorina]|uniref:arylalkylamine N-acetyltransferase 1 n=1 Tax=Xylocopa sonorina TaxID=1818115 RepID=UPI00403A7E6F
MMDNPPFRTRLALPPDYENVVDFMCDAYYKHEPVILNIGLAGTEAPPIWRTMMEDQVKYGLSIIAENRDNCIVGAALNCTASERDGRTLCDMASCIEPGPMRDVIEFFGFIADVPRVYERYCVSRLFEQASIAVSKEYQGLGIAKRLIEESWLLARDTAFRLFRFDCNSIHCASIAQGFGWTMVYDIPFAQYVKNGEIKFKHVKEPHTTCRVFVDQLNHYKSYRLPYKKAPNRRSDTGK